MEPLNDRLLRRAEVEQRIGLTGSTIYLKIAQGKFPKPIKVGVSAVRWRESEINQWIAQCAAGTIKHGSQATADESDAPPGKAKRIYAE